LVVGSKVTATHLWSPGPVLASDVMSVVLAAGSAISTALAWLGTAYSFEVIGEYSMPNHFSPPAPRPPIAVMLDTFVDGSTTNTDAAYNGDAYSLPVVGANTKADHFGLSVGPSTNPTRPAGVESVAFVIGSMIRMVVASHGTAYNLFTVGANAKPAQLFVPDVLMGTVAVVLAAGSTTSTPLEL